MILLTHERQWRGGKTAVAFGMFDGVHEGHAQLMRKANELVFVASDGDLCAGQGAAAAGNPLGKNPLDRPAGD